MSKDDELLALRCQLGEPDAFKEDDAGRRAGLGGVRGLGPGQASRVLFGRQQIVAARLAVGITVVFFAGSVAIRERAGTGAVLTAAAMCAAAIAMLSQAHRRVALLLERRSSGSWRGRNHDR